jgi:hypothetical protein
MDLLESVSKNLHKFCDERVPSRQTVHNLVNKLRTMGFFDRQETELVPSAY